jgi:hypothetical protein
LDEGNRQSFPRQAADRPARLSAGAIVSRHHGLVVSFMLLGKRQAVALQSMLA